MRDKKSLEGDDGRVIAPMNVEGMPWYTPSTSEKTGEKRPRISREESRAMTFAVLKAALLLATVFGGAAALFILFCTKLWLK